MKLTEICLRKPIIATIISLLLVAIGAIAFLELPVREYPDTDAPIVTITTDYRGAAAEVVEARITRAIEDQLSGLDGLKSIESSSQDGRSQIRIEFTLNRDVDAAANDVRDRVGRALADLPGDIDPPEVAKVDADANPIMWFNLASDNLDRMALTDYARRVIAERLGSVPGVGAVRISGGMERSMRVWLDPDALSARGLTVIDIEEALRRQNIELPAGRLESEDRYFAMRIERSFSTPEQFGELVVSRGENGHLVRLSEVAEVEVGARDHRAEFRGNGIPMVGIGVVRQSGANAVDVANAVRAEVDRIRETLPAGLTLATSFDSTFFIGAALKEVGRTLALAAAMVIAVIWAFLGSWRATIVPALTVPISIIATFGVLFVAGYSVNLVTLLALVLAIGLVVDDAIVVIENIHRRIEQGEAPLEAAYHGVTQVSGAVISTTLVLVSVFVPIAFLDGNIGRVFSELAIAVSAAVIISTFIALTLAPALGAHVLKPTRSAGDGGTPSAFARAYLSLTRILVAHPILTLPLIAGAFGGILWLATALPQEFAPAEDRGRFSVIMTAPEGASYEYSSRVMRQIETIMLPYLDTGEAIRVLIRTPARIDGREVYNSGWVTIVLDQWNTRQRSAQEMIAETRRNLSEVPGVRAGVFGPRPFNIRQGSPVQVVIGGATYEDLVRARDVLLERARENPGLTNVQADYKETKPQFLFEIDLSRAADLGVSVQEIGRTLETLMGGREVTTYLQGGEEFDVIVQAAGVLRAEPSDLDRVYVRSATSGSLIPISSLLRMRETASAPELPRTDRLRTITISADLVGDHTLAEALNFFRTAIEEEAANEVSRISYKGESREFVEAGNAIYFTFGLAILLVFLVLAGQFNTFVLPLSIMLGVPMALGGGLLGLWVTGASLNVYSQIGLVMLVGLAAKNGILIVEFANQLRNAEMAAGEAAVEAARLRLRPILMTGFSTAAGAIPMILATGAGSEPRIVIGTVVLSGVLLSTAITLILIPPLYALFARATFSQDRHMPVNTPQEKTS